ncbi:hypothetical protein NQZ68_008501 [Dissostichus eleginoides]|nr:hypothetical protein NQZ68_008501 [Dissostichus eleginoides]
MLGIDGLCGLTASLARMPPRLPLFCFLSDRLQRHFSSWGVALEGERKIKDEQRMPNVFEQEMDVTCMTDKANENES